MVSGSTNFFVGKDEAKGIKCWFQFHEMLIKSTNALPKIVFIMCFANPNSSLIIDEC